jgi:L-ascorbate metabolism protein UlaG (beta-lactamase superfamily)
MVDVTWLGHASWMLQFDTTRVLIDPFLDNNPASPVKAADVSADYVLVTHGHGDHMEDAAVIANRCNATLISNYEITAWFSNKHQVKKTIGMNLGGSVKLSFGTVKLTIAFHSSTMPDGSSGGNPGGFLIRIGDRNIYIAGDTALFGDMERIGRVRLDLAVLPIGDLFTMGIDDSIEAIKLLNPERVAPSHYNTWPPIEQDAVVWAERVTAETSATPVVPIAGQAFHV